MATTVHVRKKGQFTIPADIREQLGIEENEIVTVSVLNNKIMVVIPQKIKTTEILKKTSEIAKKRGITLDEMLMELDEIRHQS